MSVSNKPPSKRNFLECTPVTPDELILARRLAARLVRDCGEQYWPILIRVNTEYEARRTKDAMLEDCLTASPTIDHDPDRMRQTERQARGEQSS